jgi:hypothetical protein
MESIKLTVVTDDEGMPNIETACGKKIDGIVALSVSRELDSLVEIKLTGYAFLPSGEPMTS